MTFEQYLNEEKHDSKIKKLKHNVKPYKCDINSNGKSVLRETTPTGRTINSQVYDSFEDMLKDTKTEKNEWINESFIVESNPAKEVLRHHIEIELGQHPLEDSQILAWRGNNEKVQKLINKFKLLIEDVTPAAVSYEFSINKQERQPEIQVSAGGSIRQTHTSLIDYIKRNPDELDKVLSAMSMGMKKDFDASILGADKTKEEKLKYLINIVNSKFPDMTMPYDMQVRNNAVKVNPER
ncbi:MAG: hypothetical protein WC755_09140 [Candidatus Woesearchaeota archaeon]|jgi:hypothetical protein